MTLQFFESHHVPEPNSGCWLWLGTVMSNGYGRAQVKSPVTGAMINILAHRASWSLHRGAIPAGLFVCHKCDNRLCVNPDHLFLGTIVDNNLDMRAKGRQVKGRGVPQAKLTEALVLAIRSDRRSHKEIAKACGLSKSTIGDVKRGNTWKFVRLGDRE